MWSIESLKKLTQAAKVQAEQERLRQEEIARREALEKQQAELRRQEELARQAQLQQDADDLFQALILRGIRSAANLERSIVVSAPAPVMQLVANQLKGIGIFCRALGPAGVAASDLESQQSQDDIKGHPQVKPKTFSKLYGLLNHMSDIRYEHHKANVTEWINAYETNGGLVKLMRKLDHTIQQIRTDFHLQHQDPMVAYYNLHLKPLLDRESDTDHSDDHSSDTAYRITLNPREPRDVVMSEFADVPTWMLGTSGSGLVRNILMQAEGEARAGHNHLAITFEKIDSNPSRWGDNQMHKVSKYSEPLGVAPFAPEILGQSLACLGFEAEIDSHHVKLAW
jgi:hypothetical protein